MQRSFEECVKEAGELARRSNAYFIALFAGLILAWSAIEVRYFQIATSIQDLARINVGKEHLERDAGRERKAQGSFRRQYFKSRAQLGANCPGGPQCLEKRREVRSSKAKAISSSRSFDAQTRTINALIKERVVPLRTQLSDKISFDVGFGVKVPFEFLYAALIWLGLLVVILFRIAIQRGKFWRLIALGLSRVPIDDRRIAGARLTDMPFWLAPAPRACRWNILQADFNRIVGWHQGNRRSLIYWFALAILALVVLRLAWIGFMAGGLAQYLADDTDSPQTIVWVEWSVAAVAALALLAVASLGVPWWTSLRADLPAYARRDRRGLIAAGVGIGFLLLVRLAVPTPFSHNWSKAQTKARNDAPRHKPRLSPWTALAGASLPSGWYRNAVSGSIHYVWPNNKVRYARGLLAKNLRPIQPAFLGGDYIQAAAVPAWVRSRDFPLVVRLAAETIAGREAVEATRVERAVDLLIVAARHRVLLTGVVSVLPLMDQAFALSRKNRLGAKVARLIKVARTLGDRTPIRSARPLSRIGSGSGTILPLPSAGMRAFEDLRSWSIIAAWRMVPSSQRKTPAPRRAGNDGFESCPSRLPHPFTNAPC